MANKKEEIEFVEDEVVIAVNPPELAPNIAYVGEGEPFKFFNTATGRISLPGDQSKPFYHEKAELIINTWPLLYKPVVAKGA